MVKKTLYYDTEGYSAGREIELGPREYVRLFQYAWDDGPVHMTTDYDEMISLIREADFIVAHNQMSYDLTALFGYESLEPLRMARERKVIDTFYLANLLIAAPERYKMRNGRVAVETSDPVSHSMMWLSLDNLCFQLGLEGKLGNLKDLAKKYNPPGTKVADYEYGLIDLEDPEFLAYAEQDVIAVRSLYKYLLGEIKRQDYPGDYIWREMYALSAIVGQIHRNGIKVDVEFAENRIAKQEERKIVLMQELVDKYDFPTEGKSPWASAAGKEATLKAMSDYGFTPDSTPEWPRTPKGAPKLGGKDLLLFTEGTEAEDFVRTLGELKGQRSTAQLVLDNLKPDGRVHPDITALQRSGRFCLPETHKLLTKRGVLHVNDVREGDETLDMRNRWVKVKRIHRYATGEVHTYENKTSFLESTPEHRWVQWTEDRATRTVEPLFAQSSRRRLQLTPDSYPFFPQEAYIWSDMTERERRAFLIGLLVTDGTAVKYPDRSTGRFGVYQTELKFYEELRDFLGDLVTTDYSRPVWKNPSNTIHELRLDQKEVQTILDLEGLVLEGHLRHSEQLVNWVLSLSYTESQAFMTAVYLADGNVRSKSTVISTMNENLVPVLQIAAYRCGMRSNYRQYVNKMNGLVSGRVALTRDRISTRTLTKPEVSHQPVWCVETDTGTFTAWGPDGRWSGPYLTGNSFTRPGVTIFGDRTEELKQDKAIFTAEEGKVMAGFDYSNADARAMAGLSGDHEYALRFAEDEEGNLLYDGHNLSGQAVFGEAIYYEGRTPEENPKPRLRPVAKVYSHASNYGIGAYKLATQLNLACKQLGIDLFFWAPAGKNKDGTYKAKPIPVPDKFADVVNRDSLTGAPIPDGMFLTRDMIDRASESYPFLARFKLEAYEEAETFGYVTNAWGRKIFVHKSRAYTGGPAAYGQNATAEMMKDAIISLCERGEYYIRAMRAIIHDELLMEFDEATIDRDIAVVKECMEVDFDPKNRVGFKIKFPVGHGYGKTWKDAGHG